MARWLAVAALSLTMGCGESNEDHPQGARADARPEDAQWNARHFVLRPGEFKSIALDSEQNLEIRLGTLTKDRHVGIRLQVLGADGSLRTDAGPFDIPAHSGYAGVSTWSGMANVMLRRQVDGSAELDAFDVVAWHESDQRGP
jgi:hypothetical protein